MVEAAFMQSVPDAVRGRVFGFYVMVTGFIGALAPWAAGMMVKHLGTAMANGSAYSASYAILGSVGLTALAGLPCLHAIRKREQLDPASLQVATPPAAIVPQTPAK